MERRDSLGMVAKEHTKKIMKESKEGVPGLTGKESNQLSTLDGNSGTIERNSVSSSGSKDNYMSDLKQTEIQ